MFADSLISDSKLTKFTNARAPEVLLLYYDFHTFSQLIIGIFITRFFGNNIFNTTDVWLAN